MEFTEKTAAQYATGETCKLKSGGPEMTIADRSCTTEEFETAIKIGADVSKLLRPGTIICTWFAGDKTFTEAFSFAMLEVIKKK